MVQVAISKCEEYNLNTVRSKIEDTLNMLGGIEKLIPKNSRVFIKLNCVGPFDPSLAITTHPVFVQAVIQLIKKQTDQILIGDNPATKNIIYTLKKCGIYNVIQEEDIPIFDPEKLVMINNPKAKLFHQFEVSRDMAEADILINLPKLKTHTLTYMSVAQKNLFGFIYGLNKSGWHVRANNPLQFGEALNDLYGAILETYKGKKILSICDGILGLEGEGPSKGGSPKISGVILSSLDSVSLDRVACEIVKLDPEKLYVTKIAHERGYGVGNLHDINLLGEPLTSFKTAFEAPKSQYGHWGLRLLKYRIIRNIVLEHPVIDISLCIRCGECAKICPPKTMVIKDKEYPNMHTISCIRCWCCAEVCPQNAIKKSKRPLLGRLVLKKRL